MKYFVEPNRILIPDNAYFSAEKTLACGQVFRYKKIPALSGGDPNGGLSAWQVISAGRRAVITERGRETAIECADAGYFIDYFDLRENYETIEREVLRRAGSGPAGDFMRRAAEFGRGVRILRQDFCETAIGFIISANNNIKRIQGIIERLCAAAGVLKTDAFGDYFAFPALDTLAVSGEKLYTDIGAGYRSRYIGAAAALLNSRSPENPAESFGNPAELQELPGVGPKVADCIALFALRQTGAFPVDTWIAQAYNTYFGRAETDRKIIRARLTEQFGGVSGFAQQYMFHYYRTGVGSEGKIKGNRE